MIPKHIPYTGFVQRQAAISTDRADYALLLLADKAGDVGRVEKQRCELYEIARSTGQARLMQRWFALKSQQYLQSQPDCPRDKAGALSKSDGKYTEIMLTVHGATIAAWITMKLGDDQTITCKAPVSVGAVLGAHDTSHPALIGEL